MYGSDRKSCDVQSKAAGPAIAHTLFRRCSDPQTWTLPVPKLALFALWLVGVGKDGL